MLAKLFYLLFDEICHLNLKLEPGIIFTHSFLFTVGLTGVLAA
jgi:hypothetical protein